jgi:radical SAM protein (TIGR01212 family)
MTRPDFFGGKRYNSYSGYFKSLFGERIQKISVNAGFTCPNRDGTLSTGGCTYCNNEGFSPSYCQPSKSVTRQLEEGIEFHLRRYRRANKYLAYFQSFSNTYAPLDKLVEIYSEALKHPLVAGLVIGTRPDCIDDEKLEFFRILSRQHYIMIEYGIESCYNETLQQINRHHTFEQSVYALEQTTAYGIKTGAHIIFGLPGESRRQMLDEAIILSGLPINNVKFHQLQILKNTSMAKQFQQQPELFQFFSLNEYIEFIIDFLELLSPKIIIERFTGEVPPRYHAGPDWGLIRNDKVNKMVDERLEKRNTWQGKKFIG